MSYEGAKPRSKRRSPASTENNHEIPFVDAHQELGETPLEDIDTFVIPGRDDRGGYQTATLNMPPYMYRQIQVILKSGRFPYLEVSDFIRHAIYRHLRFCVQIRHSIPKHIIPSMDAMMEHCRDSEFRLRVQTIRQEIDRQIDLLLKNGEAGEAVRLLNILKQRLEEVPDSPRQREVRAALLEKMGYVLSPDGSVTARQ